MAGQDKDYAPLSRYHCALSYYLSGDYAVSAGEFSQFVVLYNQDLLVPMATYYSLASLFYESLRKYNNPENPEAFKQLQEILEPTIKQLQGLVSTYPGTEASTLASILASESSDIPFPEEKTVAFSCPVFDLASYAKDALAKYPAGPAKALFDEGEGLMEKQLYQEAGGCFLAIVNNFPDSGLVLSAQYKLGLLYGNLSAFTQGISAFKEVLKIDPKNELAGDCLYLIAYYYMSVNNYGTATKYLEQLIRAFPFSLRTPWAKKDIELMKQELEAKKAKKEAEAMKKKSLLEKEKQIHAIDTKIPIHE
jgi:TolA-binding protein